jgi:RNA polymerase sigma-70 factor (ECF subfamily)
MSGPLASLSDEELVRRYQEGLDEEGAMLELYERHRSVTYAFLRRRIGVPEIAAEENQELYVTVLQNLRSFRGECSFRTWLFQIAHHRLSHLRRRWGIHLDERTDEIPDDVWARLPAAPASDPEKQVRRAEVVTALKRCLAALPEIERAVIYGQYYAGITLKMLSASLETTNKSGARALLIAAQRRLRACLEASGVRADILSEPLEEGTP